MQPVRFLPAVVGLALALMSTTIYLATPDAAPLSDKPGTALAGDADVMFLRKAAQAGALEIEASRMAEKKASSAAVKQFAAQMIKDHSAASAKMEPLAKRLGVQLPASPPEVQKQELAQMNTLNGAAFDQAYAQKIGVEAHEEAVSLFREAAKDTKDDGVQAFARDTLPTLQHHLDMAKKMAGQVRK
ncbi:DUF4142 domain-containing protein [Cupriavidus agavae]|uniref:Putative membrane protein n=1 Tax=Cupriavidus agavae TaxID=1001822 RepID=A0A4Q7SAU1_9BURK|nr:DUF4142 domain-containing protein [Cupriavidus agavae]RZT42492.1 putative membrane protein [Cupriavidus agavae]